MELNSPNSIAKIIKTDNHDKQGWIEWIWDLMRPPQANRRKQ